MGVFFGVVATRFTGDVSSDRLPYHPYPGDFFLGILATRFVDGNSGDRLFPKKNF